MICYWCYSVIHKIFKNKNNNIMKTTVTFLDFAANKLFKSCNEVQFVQICFEFESLKFVRNFATKYLTVRDEYVFYTYLDKLGNEIGRSFFKLSEVTYLHYLTTNNTKFKFNFKKSELETAFKKFVKTL